MQQKKSKCQLRLVSKQGSFADALYPPRKSCSPSESMSSDGKARLEESVRAVKDSMTRLQQLMAELRSFTLSSKGE